MQKTAILLFIAILFTFSCKKDDVETIPARSEYAPTAEAGKLQSVITGNTVQLDGSASKGISSLNISFKWEIITMPVSSSTNINNISISHPSFVADVDGTYKIKLIVNDGTINSAPDTVTIISNSATGNAPPVAHAGHDQSIHIGATVTLDGSASSDANGHPLIYSWSIKTKPSSSTISLSNTSDVMPTITPDVIGDYIIILVVNDGNTNSQADEVILTVANLSLKQQLVAMYVDPVDADFLIANHLTDVQAVLAQNDRIFKGMPDINTMFALASDPDAAPFSDNLMTNWSQVAMVKFKKMFGRMAFVVNSPKFKQAFNNHIGLLNTAYQGSPPSIAYPANYSQFKLAANTALMNDNYQYKFFISDRASWVAYGMAGLKLKVENVMFGNPTPGAPHNTEALILHEITHTWGYAHDGPNNEVVNHPNNIPYYVQFLVGVSAVNPTAPMVWDTPEALLTVYFGNP